MKEYINVIANFRRNKMGKREIKADILLILTALIWGLAFVAQRKGAEHLGAMSFNGIRFIIGSISLMPLIAYRNKRHNPETREFDLKKGVLMGSLAGVILFIAASLQQMGVAHTTAGKAGFITALYMVIVPILGIPLKQKTNMNTWIGIGLAVIGMYLLSINGSMSISKGDLLVLMGSFFWAVHILIIDSFTKKMDSICLSSIQFAVCGILSMVTALFFEDITFAAVRAAMVPILYGGVLSVGVAYTLQAVAQKSAKPSHAAIFLSLESVFAFLGGAVILNEMLMVKEVLGCILIFVAIIITQIKPKKIKLYN